MLSVCGDMYIVIRVERVVCMWCHGCNCVEEWRMYVVMGGGGGGGGEE